MNYKLKRPCVHCPFRTDVPSYLREGRAVEIAQSLASGFTFPCHKTTTLDDDYDGEFYAEQGGEQFCAGALIMLEKMERPNQIMRIAERMGFYDASHLDMDAPVVASFDEFVAHHGESQSEPSECCSVCGPTCVAPAGYMMGGMVVPASFDPDDVVWCPGCGEAVCVECIEDDLCPDCAYCAEYDD